MDTHKKYVIIVYCTCIFALVSFALYALLRYTYRLMKQRRDQTTEEFITARGTQNRWRIGWSFFATAVGAWVVTAPASFAVYTGIVGIVMYALASGMPVLIIAFFGARIQALHPDVCTLPDFVGRRFGPVARTLSVCIMLFNMAIAMLAEYTTIGILFKLFVGSVDYPIVIIVGVLTMTYTAYGGVYISIITDQAQGVATALFITVLVIYTAITFRPDSLPKPIPNDPLTGWTLGANEYGYSAIFSMPCSLLASTVFSEAIWQKVWASKDRSSVIFGGAMGFVLITLAVFIMGFGGWLAAWAGWVPFDLDANLFLFQIFNSQSEDPTLPAQLSSWVGVICLILACTMNEGAVDSLQNGIASVIAQHWFKHQHTIFPRLVVILVNVPLIVISLQGFRILSLFLIANMLTTCAFLLIVLGLVTSRLPDRPDGRPHGWGARAFAAVGGVLERHVTETGLVFGFCVAMLTCTAYGIGDNWMPEDHALSIRYGAWYTWYGNATYDWDYFLVAASFSLVGLIMWVVGAAVLRLCGIHGPGISGLLRPLPGFEVITGSGFKRDLLSYPCTLWLARLLRYTPRTGEVVDGETGADPAQPPLFTVELDGDGNTANGNGNGTHAEANGNGTHAEANGNGHAAVGNGAESRETA